MCMKEEQFKTCNNRLVQPWYLILSVWLLFEKSSNVTDKARKV